MNTTTTTTTTTTAQPARFPDRLRSLVDQTHPKAAGRTRRRLDTTAFEAAHRSLVYCNQNGLGPVGLDITLACAYMALKPAPKGVTTGAYARAVATSRGLDADTMTAAALYVFGGVR